METITDPSVHPLWGIPSLHFAQLRTRDLICCGWHCFLQEECPGLFHPFFFSANPKQLFLLNGPHKALRATLLLPSVLPISCLPYQVKQAQDMVLYLSVFPCLAQNDAYQISDKFTTNLVTSKGQPKSIYLQLVVKTVSFYIQLFSVFSFLDKLQPQKEWSDLDRQAPHTQIPLGATNTDKLGASHWCFSMCSSNEIISIPKKRCNS